MQYFSLDNGRILLVVSGTRCDAIISKAVEKDGGTWIMTVGIGHDSTVFKNFFHEIIINGKY